MPTLWERISRGDRLVIDGAMGSWLIHKGLKAGQCPEELNLSRPEWVEEISRRYVETGADILQTNTFGASPLKLASYGLEKKVEEINQQAFELAKRAAAHTGAYVAASCGPSGKLLQPYGDASPEEAYESFLRQMEVLRQAGIDAIIVETMTDLNEALIALRAARDAAPALPALVTLTFAPTPRGFFTVRGDSIPKAAAELEQAGASVVGSNCGNGIEGMVKIAQEFKKATRLPLLIQSSAGLPEVVEGQLVYPEGPEFFEPHVQKLISLGVSLIGGCCGTTPDHIRTIRRAVDSYN